LLFLAWLRRATHIRVLKSFGGWPRRPCGRCATRGPYLALFARCGDAEVASHEGDSCSQYCLCEIRGTAVIGWSSRPWARFASPKVISSLDQDLDKQALAAASAWRSEPACKDGKPVAEHLSIEVAFKRYQRESPDPPRSGNLSLPLLRHLP
jgi:hypothetical protein